MLSSSISVLLLLTPINSFKKYKIKMIIDESFFENNEFREKLDNYERCLADGRTPFMDADDLTDIADYYNYYGEAGKANDAIELALELEPGATLPLVFKTKAALQTGDIEQAMRYASSITDKGDPETTYLTAEIMIVRGEDEKADSFLRKNMNGIDEDIRQDYITDVAYIWCEYCYYERAAAWLAMLDNAGNAIDTDNTDIIELAGRINFGLQNYHKSITAFEKVIDKKPFSARVWYYLASAYYFCNDMENALKSIDFTIAIKPDNPDCILLKSNILMKMKDFTQAIELLTQYIKMVPDDMLAYVNMAVCYRSTGDIEKAAKQAKMAVDCDDKEAAFQACEELVYLALETGDAIDALEWVEKADKLTENISDKLVLRAYVMLAQKRLDEAMPIFMEAIDRAEDKMYVVSRMIGALFDNGYKKMGMWATRYYCKELQDITDEELDSMTPEDLMAYLEKKIQQQ